MTQYTVQIIIPVFNEEECIQPFFERLIKVLKNTNLNQSYQFNILFMNNASSDASFEIIRKIQKINSNVELISLSRNFGYQASLMCALTNAYEDISLIIDVDGEDPPELIPEFLKYIKEYEIVYGLRRWREEFIIIVWLRKFFYRLAKTIADSEFILDMAEFSAFKACIRDVIVSNRSTYPFIRSEIAYAGYRIKEIPYRRMKRIGGRTNYNFINMFKFAVSSLLSVSTFPLRFMLYVTLVTFLFYILNVFLMKIIPIEIFTSFLLILIMFFLSLAALYIARIYKDSVSRPLFIINNNLTFVKRPLRSGKSMLPNNLVI